MKKIKTIGLMLFAGIALTSCNEQNEDVVKQPNHDGSVETILTVTHESNFDLLTTKHNIWIKGKLAKTIIKNDTLENLGSTIQDAEDNNGNTKKMSVPKDYEFYITVK